MILTPAERAELLRGPAGPSAFPDPTVRALRWREHRDALVASAAPGQRPWAWWRLERGIDVPDDQAAALEAAGMLTPAERGAMGQRARELRRAARRRAKRLASGVSWPESTVLEDDRPR